MAYDASANQVFFARLAGLSRAMRDTMDEAKRLDDLWTAEAISSDPAFVAVNGVTTAEATDMITVARAYDDFFRNVAVPTADRIANLTPFLSQEF